MTSFAKNTKARIHVHGQQNESKSEPILKWNEERINVRTISKMENAEKTGNGEKTSYAETEVKVGGRWS